MHLSLTGVAQVERDGLSPVPLAPIDAVMLAWLAVEGPTSRARMAALLWPDSTEAQARTALRQRLLRLKRTVGIDLASGGATTLQLDAGMTHDLANSESLLRDLCLPDAPELDDWLRTQREQRRACARDSLQDQAQRLEDAGQPEAALAVAQALLRMEPLSELAHRRVMRLHYLCGDRAAALAAFDRCETLLKDEVGTRPSAETLAVLATIEAQAPATVPVARRAVPASVLRPPRMVGRERECAQLEQAWAVGNVAAVIGEAGMGKSRLLHEFMQQHAGIARAAGRPGDAGVPYATLARLLRAVADQPRDAAPALTIETREEIARVLPEMGDLPMRHHEGRQLRLCRAISAYLAACGVRALCVDDLHFADAASLEMIQALIDQELGFALDSPALGWMLAFRPAEAGSALLTLQHALDESARVTSIRVGPLDEAALARLVDDLALPGVHGAALAPMLMRRTGGNPLFALETLKQAWIERSLDQPGHEARLPHPASVERLIERRLAQLSSGALALARVASVAGVDFSVALAESVLGVGAIQLVDPLNELELAQVLRGTQFMHDLIYETVLASIPQALARHLHAQVAGFLARAKSEPARIAAHWDAAGEWAQAGGEYMPAAQLAARAGRRLESAALLGEAARCFELAGDDSACFEAQLKRAETLARCELGDAARQAVTTAEQAAHSEEQHLRALIARIEFCQHRGEINETLSLAPDALARARAAGLETQVFRLSTPLAGALCQAGRGAEAVSLLEGLRGWVDTQADDHQRHAYWSALSLSLDFAHRLTEAAQAWRVTREHAERIGPDRVSLALTNLSWTLFKGGLARQAAEVGLQGLSQLQAAGDYAPAAAMIPQIGVANFLRHAGRLSEAVPMYESAYAVLRESGMGLWTATCEHGLAQTYQCLGQPARARALLAGSLSGVATHMQAMRLVFRADLARALDRPADAQGLVHEALELLPDREHIAYRVASLFAAVMLPPAQGEALATALASWASVRGRLGLALAGHVRAAGCAMAQGATERALAHVDTALHLSETYEPEMLWPAELWLHAANVLIATGDLGAGRDVLGRGSAWLQGIAREHVPAEFRDSFMQRNPTNAALIALASKHGVSQRERAATPKVD